VDGELVEFTETIVRTGADGAPIVTYRIITAAEERAQNAARDRTTSGAPQPLDIVVDPPTEDPTCAPTDLWIYDQPNFSGNRLCLRPGNHPETNWESDIALHTLTRWLCTSRFNCRGTSWALMQGSVMVGDDVVLLTASPPYDVRPPHTSSNFVRTDREGPVDEIIITH
jgi:hypothetical protein